MNKVILQTSTVAIGTPVSGQVVHVCDNAPAMKAIEGCFHSDLEHSGKHDHLQRRWMDTCAVDEAHTLGIY
jgi:hypothetical protein